MATEPGVTSPVSLCPLGSRLSLGSSVQGYMWGPQRPPNYLGGGESPWHIHQLDLPFPTRQVHRGSEAEFWNTESDPLWLHGHQLGGRMSWVPFAAFPAVEKQTLPKLTGLPRAILPLLHPPSWLFQSPPTLTANHEAVIIAPISKVKKTEGLGWGGG